jgi:hypothetical protein
VSCDGEVRASEGVASGDLGFDNRGNWWSAPRLHTLTLGKKKPLPIEQGKPQSRFGRCKKEKNTVPYHSIILNFWKQPGTVLTELFLLLDVRIFEGL